ncbi:MAG TPA: magnesium/cobalt transporter CorA [Rhodocyclaceae bacterium]|nr:magnesium/cobalt transporter CorA [Rhodocyclaceae bacterium]
MLINCVAYQNGQKLADIPVAAISDYLGHKDAFVWVGLVDADTNELAAMQEEFGLHPLAVEDANHGHQRPKIEEYGDSLFAVLHLVELAPNDMLNIGEMAIFLGPNYLLSVRNRSAQTFLDVRARCEREPQLLQRGPAYVLYALMDAVVDRYLPIMQEFEARLDIIEAEIFSQKHASRAIIRQLYNLKRDLMELRHAVAPLMDGVSRLAGGRVPAMCDGMQAYFRDVYDHLTRLIGSIESMRDTIATAIQVNLAMAAIDEGEVNKRLAAWAAIFAVATAFAGIWGMNFNVMPELHWRYGYPAALALIATSCFLLYRRFKKVGWL